MCESFLDLSLPIPEDKVHVCSMAVGTGGMISAALPCRVYMWHPQEVTRLEARETRGKVLMRRRRGLPILPPPPKTMYHRNTNKRKNEKGLVDLFSESHTTILVCVLPISSNPNNLGDQRGRHKACRSF